MPEPWNPSTDPLGEALHFLRMSGAFYCLSEFTAPWGLDLPPMQDCVMFHVVTAGECRLEVEGAQTRATAGCAGTRAARPRSHPEQHRT
jgi:hypothetical protein